MSLPAVPEPADAIQGSSTVGVLGNSISTGAVLATESRSITTAATGSKTEVENKAISIYHMNISCNGDYNHSVQGTKGINNEGPGDGRRAPSASPFLPGDLSSPGGLLSPNSTDQPLTASSHLSGGLQRQEPDLDAVLQRPQSTAPRECSEYFEEMGVQICKAYDNILKQNSVKRARRPKGRKGEVKLEVKVQKDKFLQVNERLVSALANNPSRNEELGDPTSDSYHEVFQIMDVMDDIQTQVISLHVVIESFGNKPEVTPKKVLKPDNLADHVQYQTRFSFPKDSPRKKDLADCLDSLGTIQDTFEKAVLGMAPEELIPELSAGPMNSDDIQLEMEELERLSREGRVSSMLHRCLCRACPEQSHELHTSYFSLQPEDTVATSLPSPSELARVIWRCQMAFKSRSAKDPYLWLRVVSSGASVVEEHLPESNLGIHEPSSTHDPQTPIEPTIKNPRKRRAASTPPEPSRKAPKIQPGQSTRRVSELAPQSSPTSRMGMEVCPELLAQHDLDTVVMNMIDDGGHNHNIFYLPKDKRPAHGTTDPIALSTVLSKEQGLQFSYGMHNKNILHLSRLIAEAVLRFDLRDSDPSPEQSVVFYQPLRKGLAPFLKRDIRKPPHSSTVIDEEGNSSGGRSELLANLGNILLQLGLLKDAKTRDLPPQNLSGRRNYIQRAAPDVRTHLGPGYHAVIMQCMALSEHGGNTSVDGDFKEKYYHSIVKPLKEMEAYLSRGR